MTPLSATFVAIKPLSSKMTDGQTVCSGLGWAHDKGLSNADAPLLFATTC